MMSDALNYLNDQVVWDTFQEKENERISKWIDELLDEIRLMFRKRDKSAERLLREVQTSWRQIILEEESGEYFIHYQIGRLSGVIESLEEYFISDDYRAAKLTDEMICEKIEDLPHINEILIRIEHSDGIRHGRLADMVGIDKSTLTPIMAKLEKSGVIRFTSIGKYKYYYITSLGRRYLETKDTDNASERGIDLLIERLRIALEKCDDRDNLAEKVERMIGSGKYKSTLSKPTVQKREHKTQKLIYRNYIYFSKDVSKETAPKKLLAESYKTGNADYRVEILANLEEFGKRA